jgi:ABC-type multidrug transport system fused ATPase/permease subunit
VTFTLGALLFSYAVLETASGFVRQHEDLLVKAPETPFPPPSSRSQATIIMRELHRGDRTLQRAVQTRTLQYFDIEQGMRPVQRAFVRASGLLRPFAGWMLLVGIVVTLANLQGAVGSLSGAFRDISRVTAPGAPTSAQMSAPVPARERERNVTEGMANMALSASQAFRTSLAFIFLALVCMVASASLDRRGRQIFARYEGWAVEVYGSFLPSHLPVTQGNVAQMLTDTVTGMSEVVEELRTAASAFNRLEPLISSMSRANDSIQQAMQKLPEDLRSSMSNVTSEMISELSGTLGESTDTPRRFSLFTPNKNCA